jgi:hypothetical protein
MPRNIARWLGAFIVLLSAICANAQVIDEDGVFAPKASGGGGSYVGPGDIVSGAVAYYGLRCYNAAYAGNVVDVGNAATGTSTVGTRLKCSAGGIISEVVSGSACTFVTGNACSTLATTCASTCYAVNLYNQSGGTGHTLSLFFATSRPAYTTSCIGSLPCMTFTAASSEYLDDNITWTTTAQPYTLMLSFECTANSSGIMEVGPLGVDCISTANTLQYYSNSPVNVSGVNINTLHNAVIVFANPNACASDVDGAVSTGNNCGTSSATTLFQLGNNGTSSLHMQGNIQEVAIYPSPAFTTGVGSQAANMVANMAAYW